MAASRSAQPCTPSSVQPATGEVEDGVALKLTLADVSMEVHHDVFVQVEVGVPKFGPTEASVVGILIPHLLPSSEQDDPPREVGDVRRVHPVPHVLHVKARVLADVQVIAGIDAPGYPAPEDEDVRVWLSGEVDLVVLDCVRKVVELLGKVVTEGNGVEDVEVGLGADQRVVDVVRDGREGVEVVGVDGHVDDGHPEVAPQAGRGVGSRAGRGPAQDGHDVAEARAASLELHADKGVVEEPQRVAVLHVRVHDELLRGPPLAVRLRHTPSHIVKVRYCSGRSSDPL
mmetsp:Transcript_61035/g.169230  ORF Transcript_61035/g.169230 Transcript_61035/m.169230 type:complete len:286 (+) Transcript_61035:103-960(+)